MLNEKIKKLVYILLLSLFVYLVFLIAPKLSNLLNFVFNIIKPFLIAFVLSFILQPLVSFMQKYIKKRSIAVLIVMISFVILIIVFLRYIANTLIYEFEQLSAKLPDLLQELEVILNNLFQKIPLLQKINISFQDIINESSNLIGNSIFNGELINKITSFGKYLIVTPIILIYFLLDYEKIICYLRNYLIDNDKIKLKDYLGELNKTMTSYFRGVLAVMLILFMTFSIAFMIIGVENGMVFALIIAITNVIPYIGSWIGTGLPVLYVLLTSQKKAIIVLIVCVVIQTIEADVLTPLIQGKKTKLHPLIIVLSLLIFGSLFGFIGMLIAVPMAAIINITLKYYPLRIIKIRKNE